MLSMQCISSTALHRPRRYLRGGTAAMRTRLPCQPASMQLTFRQTTTCRRPARRATAMAPVCTSSSLQLLVHMPPATAAVCPPPSAGFHAACLQADHHLQEASKACTTAMLPVRASSSIQLLVHMPLATAAVCFSLPAGFHAACLQADRRTTTRKRSARHAPLPCRLSMQSTQLAAGMIVMHGPLALHCCQLMHAHSLSPSPSATVSAAYI